MEVSIPSDPKHINVTLQISLGEDAYADEIDQLTRSLRDEIEDLGVESVTLVKDDTKPQGTKAADAFTLGALAVAVLPAVIPKLVGFLQSWSMRGENRVVKIKTQVGDRSLEVEYSPKSMSSDELKHLVDRLTGTVEKDKDSHLD